MGPVNLGNPNEFTIKQLAEHVVEIAGGGAGFTHKPLPADDPTQRQPDISLAKAKLDNWANESGPFIMRMMPSTRSST